MLGLISTLPGFLPLFLATPLVFDVLGASCIPGPRAFDADSPDGAGVGMAGLGTLGAGPRVFDAESLDGPGGRAGMAGSGVVLDALGAGPRVFDEDSLDGASAGMTGLRVALPGALNAGLDADSLDGPSAGIAGLRVALDALSTVGVITSEFEVKLEERGIVTRHAWCRHAARR